jgi:hypothetical protein
MWIDILIRAAAALAPYTWPLVVLLLVFYFRKAINERLANVREMDWKNKVIRFGDARTDGDESTANRPNRLTTALPENQLPASAEAVSPGGIKWGNTGNLYWLGHDLMWTMQIALRGAPKADLLRGLRQSYYQLSHLGVTGNHEVTLKALLDQVEAMPESSLDRSWRNGFSGKVSSFIDEVGKLATKNQPDFEKDV